MLVLIVFAKYIANCRINAITSADNFPLRWQLRWQQPGTPKNRGQSRKLRGRQPRQKDSAHTCY